MILLFCVTSINAQEIRQKEDVISSTSLGYLSYTKVYENDIMTKSYMIYVFQNRKYSQIVDLKTLFQGSPKEFKAYLDELKSFLIKYDDGTSAEIQGKTVSISKIMGKKMLTVYDIDMLGYTWFAEPTFKKFNKKLIKWAKKNNVELE